MSFYSLEDAEMSSVEIGPCPVCKHPTGDCIGDSHFNGGVMFKPKRKPDPAETFSLPERVYEEYEDKGKMKKRLLYAKGTRVRPAEARRLGFLK
jgi:hypothetical protein